MKPNETQKMYPLQPILETLRVTPAAFHQHVYKGVLAASLQEITETSLVSQISIPMRGTGVVRDGGRFITWDGAIGLGVFFRLISGGVPSAQALRIAQTFIFLGETGNRDRAFAPGNPRPAGQVFPGPHDTIVAAISDASTLEKLVKGAGDGFAFVPGPDLSSDLLAEWLGERNADSAPVCLVNLSELIAEIRAGVEDLTSVAIDVDYLPGTPAQDWPDRPSDPVVAFLSEHVDRDPRGRTSALDFRLAFSAWYVRWKGDPIADRGKHGRGLSSVLGEALADLGVRKMKSNGKLTFAGIEWRETPATQALLSDALGRE